MSPELPPLTEIFSRSQFIQRHPGLFNKGRLDWAVRNRDQNGLTAARAVYESPVGEILIHEPPFLRWFLGLSGRGKPRALRHRGRAS